MTLGGGYVPQPYVAWVDFWIHSKTGSRESLTLNNGKPVRFMGFEHKMSSDVSNSWKLRLFDPEWDKVTNLLRHVTTGGSVHPHATFRYYYTGPNKEQTLHSKLYNAVILGAKPTIGTHGLTLEVNGEGAEFVGHMQQKTRAHVKTDGSGKPIGDIVRDVIREHSTENVPWREGTIVDTEPVRANLHVRETKPKDVVFQQKNSSDLQFIHKVLIPYAVSREKRVGDYVFVPHDEGTHIKCDFQPRIWYPDVAPASIRVFNFMWGEKNSEVLGFSPDIQSDAYLLVTGGGDIKTNATSSTASAVTEILVNQQNTAGKLLMGDKTVSTTTDGAGVAGRNVPDAAINTDVAHIKLVNRWQRIWDANQDATLVIQGDPRIRPQQYIKIFVWLPGRVPHEFSGVWKVNDITHTIQPGKFESSLALIRHNSPIGEVAEGELIFSG